jgi:calcium channel MID1
LKDGNCAVIFNLSFCNSVAYAVPGNPTNFSNITALADFYDTGAQNAYANFDLNMQQIPCEIDSTGQYSLARNCTQCRNAYKSWLCSVMIPRCMDYSSTQPYLQARNVVRSFPNNTSLDPAYISQVQNILYLNSSRNPAIDTTIQPGPYKEILPCDDLCYGIVQSCPSVMGFSCPRPGQLGFNHSYGLRQSGQQGQVTCNYPGAVYNLNVGPVRSVPFGFIITAAVLLGLLLL